ncbi:hypothetical protein C9994_11280 [Marivirga lumbricoides]|uniref:Uncharacterized protein n=1 Tax=Marivirga lumbricoides TaxID=1046115 RepID=A0A2T4DNQ3_9BACT|nr:hypothetical protein C9994_11280 [Marivirga lumbricoides]
MHSIINPSKLFLLVILLTSFSLFSCEDSSEVESPILIFLTPEATQIEANSGDKVFITVKASTNSGSILTLNIASIDDQYGIRNVLDSTFNNSSINYRLQYNVPAYEDSTQSLLVFTLTNQNNQVSEIAKRILVNRGETFVREASGINIYSTSSSRPNAFSLTQLKPGFSTDSTTFESDIVDNTLEDNETLSREWVSNTGISFVKFDGFNYSNANSQSIRNAFENGVQLSKISNIRDSDIYLIGRNGNALGAIQIIAVTDPEGVQEDKYTFSVKVITD